MAGAASTQPAGWAGQRHGRGMGGSRTDAGGCTQQPDCTTAVGPPLHHPLQLAFMKFLSMFWKRLASCGSCFTMSPPLNTASMYIHMF